MKNPPKVSIAKFPEKTYYGLGQKTIIKNNQEILIGKGEKMGEESNGRGK